MLEAACFRDALVVLRACLLSIVVLMPVAVPAADVHEGFNQVPVFVRGMHVFDDGGTLVAVQSQSGDMALRRLDAQGVMQWTWAGPVDALVDPFPFAVRSDGTTIATFHDVGRSAFVAVLIDKDGQEIDRWAHDAPTGRAPALLTDGVLFDQYYPVKRIASFALDGTSRGAYVLQAVGDGTVYSRGAQGWPSGRTTVREQHYDANSAPTFARLAVLDATMARVGHYELAGSLHSERELADGDVVVAGNVGSAVHLARISPTGTVRWETTFDGGAGGAPDGLRVYEHAGGVGFVGRVSDGVQSCVLHGSVAADGSGLQWACAALGSHVGEVLARRVLSDGLEIAFFSVANGQLRLFAVSKQGSGAIASRVLVWSEPSYWYPAAVGMGQGSVVAALEGGTGSAQSRLLRWSSAPEPVVDELLVGQENLHHAVFATELPSGDVLAGATGYGDFHILRTTAQGDAVWGVTRPDMIIGHPVARGAPDGSVRVLARLHGNIARLYAVDAGGDFAWHASIADVSDVGSIEIDDSGRTLVSYGDPSGNGCRFQRFDAAGAPDGALTIAGAELAYGSIRLGDGRTVWNCGGLQIIDSGLAVSEVGAGCPGRGQSLIALDANRWVAVGAHPDNVRAVRACLFDAAQFVRGAELPPPQGLDSNQLRAMHRDAAGNVWMTFLRDGALPDTEQLLHARFAPDTGVLQSWLGPVLASERFLDVAAPDERNRAAVLLGSLYDGSERRVVSGRPGQAPDWTWSLPMPEFAQPRLLRTSSALLAAHAPPGVMDGVVFRVAPVRSEALFADDFESLAQ